MEIAPTLVKELDYYNITYGVISHPYSIFSLNTARSLHIPDSELIKSVVLKDDDGFIMALVPADQHVKIRELNTVLNRNMGLATEKDLEQLFSDCDSGAVPPVGEAYGMQTVVDCNLDKCDELYIEAGNHTEVLHISAHSFHKLTENYQHARICTH